MYSRHLTIASGVHGKMDLTIPLGKLSSLYAPLDSAPPAPGLIWLSGEAERSDMGDIKRILYGMRVKISI